MKHLTTILAAVLILAAFVGAGLNIYYAISNNQDYISKAEYRGHSYIIYKGVEKGGITHDPDCPCHNKQSNNQ